MIRNPIYCGKIFIPAYKNEEAHFVKSVHQPLISEDLFNSVQDILNGKKIDRSDTNKHREELPLRGFLACSKCGGRLTGSASKGKYERYFYYHCQPGCKERHPANLTNDELIPEFRKISVTKESLQLYQMILEKELKKSGNDNSEEKKKINSEIQKQQERIDKAEQLMLDGQLEMSEYKAIKEKYEKAIKDLQTALTPVPQKSNPEFDIG